MSKKTNSITKEHAEQLIKTSAGTIFTATYVKANGRIRRLNGRTGVTRNLKGLGLSYDPNDYGLLPVFDLYVKQYRMVNLDTLTRLSIDGKNYKVV